MPLTALFKDQKITSTLCGEELWAAIYKSRPRAEIRCRWCGKTMHAKEHHQGLRHFAHDPGRSDCPTTKGETTVHMRLKIAVADAARSVGWLSDIEVLPADTDVGGWRADVLATHPDSKSRVAFEIQHSRMTTEEGRQRSANYERDEVRVVWIATSIPTWLWRFPGILVDASRAMEDGDGFLNAVVQAGVAAFKSRELMSTTKPGILRRSWSEWEVQGNLSLFEVVRAILDGDLVPHNLTLSEKARPWGRSSRAERNALTVALVTPADIKFEIEYLATQREEIVESHNASMPIGGLPGPRSRDVPVLRRRNFVTVSNAQSGSPSLERQLRILPVVCSEARAACRPGESVWIGVPPRPYENDGESLLENLGSAEWANGAMLWIGISEESLRAFAAICPVRSLLTTEVGNLYRERGCRVFAEGEYEASLLATSLGWPVAEIQARHPRL
jgi:hypothetical protein